MQEEYKQAKFQTHAQGGQIFLGAGQEMHRGMNLGMLFSKSRAGCRPQRRSGDRLLMMTGAWNRRRNGLDEG